MRFQKIGADGRALDVDAGVLFDLLQLASHTDRVLPDGYCMLPPRQFCDRGNACHGCGNFATDPSFLPVLTRQLGETRALIDQRRSAHVQRVGEPMSETNVWLEARRGEERRLTAIVTKLQGIAPGDPHSLRAAGVDAREAPDAG